VLFRSMVLTKAVTASVASEIKDVSSDEERIAIIKKLVYDISQVLLFVQEIEAASLECHQPSNHGIPSPEHLPHVPASQRVQYLIPPDSGDFLRLFQNSSECIV